MTLYTVQEFLGVLLVVAISMAILVVLGIAVILFQEAIRRARRAKAGVVAVKGLSPKQQWMQGTDGRPALRGRV